VYCINEGGLGDLPELANQVIVCDHGRSFESTATVKGLSLWSAVMERISTAYVATAIGEDCKGDAAHWRCASAPRMI
jgi:hypothetical protein